METYEKVEKDNDRKLPFYQYVGDYCLPGVFSVEAFKSCLAYKPRAGDLFIVSHPKSGSTWVENIVACILRKGKTFHSALDYITNSPCLVWTGAWVAETDRRPGAIKLHLPYNLAPWSTEAKYICLARNPKDCLVSLYHYTRNIKYFRFEDGNFEDFFELFLAGKTAFGNYFDALRSWYEHRKDANVLFITYEELKKDFKTNVFKIAEFMDLKYKEMLEKDEEIMKDIMYHSSFAFMKDHFDSLKSDYAYIQGEGLCHSDIVDEVKKLLSRKYAEPIPNKVNFMRKGIVGDWKNHLTPMQNTRLEQKFREIALGTDLPDLWKDVI